MIDALFVLAGITVVVYLFFKLYPPFGGKPKLNQLQRSPNFKRRVFVNQIPTSMAMGMGGLLSIFRDMLKNDPRRKPVKPLRPETPDLSALLAAEKPTLVWIGHSASLLRLGGKTLLLDPMFGASPSPFPFGGPKRFSNVLPFTPEALPHIDAVLVSHDHYDHLDYSSIKKLRGKVTKFFVPLGVGAHLRAWGVKPEQIAELDWWDEASFEGLKFVCTPFLGQNFDGPL